jgi:group I intron endonuclease
MYIYKTTNLINGKIYIGQKTTEFDKTYYGSGKLIKRAITKYGIKNFKVEIIVDGIGDRDVLNESEIHWIAILNATERHVGYNVSIGGNGGNLGNTVNKRISDTVKELWKVGVYDTVDFSTHKIGIARSESTKHKISEAQKGKLGYWYGKSLSESTKHKISEAGKRRFSDEVQYNKFVQIMRSEDVRRKISESLKGKTPWNAGKTGVYSVETIEKMRHSAINKNITEEVEVERRRKISEYQQQNSPIRKGVLDNDTGIEYKSITDYCEKTNTSWYKTKRYRLEGKITIK